MNWHESNHAIEFYLYAKNSKRLQDRLRRARSIGEVISIAKDKGFVLTKFDFLSRKHEWRDEFFPWAEMSINETRGFILGHI